MKFLKIALLGTAALAAASVSARADTLDSLKAAMDNLNIGAVADAPAAAAPATTVVWTGFVRAGVTTAYNSAAAAPVAVATVPPALPGFTGNSTANQYATDVRAYGEIKVTAKTETAIGEVGVAYQIQDTATGFGAANANGVTGVMTTDDISGWWKMTPNLTLTGGFLGTLAKSSYSWDANATNWWSASTGGGVWGGVSGGGDPAAIQLAYADGPLSFAMQVEDENNNFNNSAFGVSGKVGYKMDAIGFDLDGGYWGNTNTIQTAAWSISAGAGYSAGAFSFGAAVGDVQTYTAPAGIIGSAYAKLNLSDVAHVELGATHDFSTSALDGSAGGTTFGAGIYYTPVKQLAFGAEFGAQTGIATVGSPWNGSYTASLISQFMF